MISINGLPGPSVAALHAALFLGLSPCTVVRGQACSPAWSPEFSGQGPNLPVHALHTFDDGRGSALFAGGWFTRAGIVAARRVARWDGHQWSPLGAGVRGTTGGGGEGPVWALTTYDSGHGDELIVGGDFSRAGEMDTASIARWNGQWWTPMWVAPDASFCIDSPSIVATLEVLDLGGGPLLYVGGAFDLAGFPESYIQVESLASWNGESWRAVSTGIYPTCFIGPRCLSLLDVVGGNGLCVGGSFRNTSLPEAACLGVWNGTQWATLGGAIEILGLSGFASGIHAMLSTADLEGPSFYVAGNPTRAGTVPVSGIARWDGHAWHDVGGGLNAGGGIYAMTMFDDGSGPALYVGGRFTIAGGVPAANIARWDGKQWSALGSGTNGPVRALEVWDRDGPGPEPAGLYVGGEFTIAGGLNSPYIAKWQGCPACYPDCDTSTGPRTLDLFDFLCFQNRYAGGTPYACDCDTSSGQGVCDIFDFLCFQNAFAAGCP